MAAKSEKSVIRPLHGLRGVTIASVVFLHFGAPTDVLLPEAGHLVRFTENVMFRMDLFFMLSGFILCYVLGREDFSVARYLKFLRGRLIRVYPGHLAAMAVLGGGLTVCHLMNRPVAGSYPLEAVLPILTLTHAWPYLAWATPTWNFPTWFLSALWFGWLAVTPLSWKLMPWLRRSRLRLLWLFGPLVIWMLLENGAAADGFQNVIRVTCEFAAGGVLYACYAERSRLAAHAQKHVDVIALLIGAGFVLLWFAPSQTAVAVNRACLLATPLLLVGITTESGVIARLLVARPLLWLGDHSYALFMTHGLALKALKLALPASVFAGGPLLMRLLVFAAYVGVIVAFAMILRKFVEVPCKNLLSRNDAVAP